MPYERKNPYSTGLNVPAHVVKDALHPLRLHDEDESSEYTGVPHPSCPFCRSESPHTVALHHNAVLHNTGADTPPSHQITRRLRRLSAALDERHLAAIALRERLSDREKWLAMARAWHEAGIFAGDDRCIAVIDAGEALCGSPLSSTKALSEYLTGLLPEEVTYLEQFLDPKR